MTKRIAVGWSSHRFEKLKCQHCDITGQQRIVQAQKKLNVGPILFMSLGKRYFQRSCDNCKHLFDLNKNDKRKANRLRFYNKKIVGDDSHVSINYNKRYPILNDAKWNELRKENKKEGFISMALGVVIGLIMAPFVSWWFIVVILFSIGGLYAAFEDPERKHRNHFDKTGEIR